MTTKYDEAVIALYQAPLDQFVAERKRLVSELKAGGDKAGATRLAARARPPISAWTVNQLYGQAREMFDELFAAGERLRAGDLTGSSAHRDALAKLRARAEKVLGEAGHASSEATLRRITTDLAALAAVGSFDPDPPGALAGDREPPGFDMVGLAASEGAAHGEGRSRAKSSGKALADDPREKETGAERARQERERLEQERRKAEEERAARKRAERERLEATLRQAKDELKTNTQKVDRLRKELAEVERTVAEGRTEVANLERQLSHLV